MRGVPTPDLLDELWREQSCWSRTANRMKQHIERARLVALVLVVLVAVLGSAAGALTEAQPTTARVLAAIAALGAALLPTLRPAWSGSNLRDWTRARSVAEALKSEVYLWLARAGDYRHDQDASRLQDRTDKMRGDGADMLRYRHGIEPEQRALPAVHDLPTYFAVRVTAQIDNYYLSKADRLQTSLRWFRRVEIVLGVAGAVLGVAAALVGASFASWIAVIATIGTALAVHVSSTRYEFQLIEFLRTAERLRQLKRKADAGVSVDELGALAVLAEDVISVENQGWMAKLAEDPPDHQLPADEK